jgi:hypothetical protein
VWHDHLMPMLSLQRAAALRGVYKALRGMVDECPMEIEEHLSAKTLEAALTCFPTISTNGL